MEKFASELRSIQTEMKRLQERARMTSIRDNVEDLQSRVHGMAQRIANFRERGYFFEKELDDQAVDFARRWDSLQPSVNDQINRQATQLQAGLGPIERNMNQLAGMSSNPSAGTSLLNSTKAAINNMESKISAAERSVRGMYDNFYSDVQKVDYHLDKIEWMLKQLAEATFKLLPTEGGIMAVKAVWYQGGKEKDEDPDGVLYLTDQRLIFEQKEEVATKKVLFITTEKKKVQEVEWEVPVAQVEGVTTSKQGMMKNEDHIHITFNNSAPYQRIDLHVWQPCDEWVRLINRAKSKDFDSGRAVAIDKEVVEAVKNLPTQCPSCGANFDQVVLRGQDSVKCEYCGFEIRL